MAERITLSTIDERLDRVITDLDKKVDKETIKLELELIKKDVALAQTDITRINGYGRWVILVIAGGLITAILNLILRK